MKYIQISTQTIFLFIMPLIGNAETTCLDKVKTLELKRNYAVSIGGMCGLIFVIILKIEHHELL